MKIAIVTVNGPKIEPQAFYFDGVPTARDLMHAARGACTGVRELVNFYANNLVLNKEICLVAEFVGITVAGVKVGEISIEQFTIHQASGLEKEETSDGDDYSSGRTVR